jgi:hypothetical protein
VNIQLGTLLYYIFLFRPGMYKYNLNYDNTTINTITNTTTTTTEPNEPTTTSTTDIMMMIIIIIIITLEYFILTH